jgi:hypothetical protein
MKTIIITLLVASAWQASAQETTARAVIKIEPLPASECKRIAVPAPGLIGITSSVVSRSYGNGHYTFTAEELSHLPTRDINDIVAMTPGTYQKRRGDATGIYGSDIQKPAYVKGRLIH